MERKGEERKEGDGEEEVREVHIGLCQRRRRIVKKRGSMGDLARWLLARFKSF